uniref:Putative hydrolase YtaP n=1 Tax=Noccaea caerulescens TaxID=107243 RepID=A0A1J3DH95_NOCCA
MANCSAHCTCMPLTSLICFLAITGVMETPTAKAEDFRSDFLRVLRSRRISAGVPLVAECSKPVENPLFQADVPSTKAIESCPKENISNLKEMLKEENLHLHTEAGEQGRLPLLILSLKESSEERRPAIVFMHGTNTNKEWLRPWLEAYASRGYVAIGLDSRYHGERANCKTAYRDALISSWRNGKTMPFIFDTVWDLIKLAEYLTQREDIDPKRIGITGISLGGMHAWFAAAADTRYSVVVPLIGVQGFRWAIDNDEWEARVNSIKPLFEAARIDLGKKEIDKEVVEKVWNRIAPGLASQFDSPYSLPVIAPRPLYILNGAKDPRNPLGGLVVPLERAEKAYKEASSPGNIKLVAEDGVAHELTSFMIKESSDWFDKFLSLNKGVMHDL